MGDIADDHYAAMWDEQDERNDGSYGRYHPECRRCRSIKVYWQSIIKADGTPGYALFNAAGGRHLCQQQAPTADAFDVVPE